MMINDLQSQKRPSGRRGNLERQDGGIGKGDHFLPHKIIKRSLEC